MLLYVLTATSSILHVVDAYTNRAFSPTQLTTVGGPGNAIRPLPGRGESWRRNQIDIANAMNLSGSTLPEPVSYTVAICFKLAFVVRSATRTTIVAAWAIHHLGANLPAAQR
jgi:hypothetical protein